MTRAKPFLGLAAAALLAAAPTALARIYPAWSPNSTYNLSLDPGFLSVAGSYTLTLAGEPASLGLHYADEGGIAAAGVAGNFTLFGLEGTYAVDPGTGEQHVHLAEPAKTPRFVFDGVVSEDGVHIVGTFTRHDGWLGYTGEETGPLTLQRTEVGSQSRFSLAFGLRMDDHGRIRGKLAPDGRTETTASLTLYDGRAVSEGRISGKVKTDKNALTTGVVKIRGKKWKAELTGPLDQDGFHATCAIEASGFDVGGMAAVLTVQPGPEPPDGGPVKPPANLLDGATATIAAGQMTITHPNVPSKFFGKPASITVEFPTTDGTSTVTADVSTASTASPRRFIASVSGTAYGTATAPVGNGVTLAFKKFSTVRDGLVEVLATGRVFSASGKTKTVNILVRAAVQ